MTTYTFKAVYTEYDSDFINAIDAFSTVLDFVASDDLEDLTYEIIGSLSGGQQAISYSLDPTKVNLDIPQVGGLLVDAVFVSELTAGGQQYILFEYVGETDNGNNYVATMFAEAPGTFFDNVQSEQDWFALSPLITNQGAITDPNYLPNTPLSLEDFGWIEKRENDEFNGFNTDDTFFGGSGADLLFGNNGKDDLFGGAGTDTIEGGGGADNLFGGAGNDEILGEGGADDLNGGVKNDSIFGGNGNDTLAGNAGADQLFGGAEDDTLKGAGGDDTLEGGSGVDQLFGGTNKDELHGDDGADTLEGAAAKDTLFGGAGADVLKGGSGDDALFGGSGADTMTGGKGRDTFTGGTGDDEMTGGTENDLFIFADGFGDDIIFDFNANADGEKIDLTDVTGITDFTDLEDNHMAQVGNNVVITDGANTITLEDVSLNKLDGDDFVFVA